MYFNANIISHFNAFVHGLNGIFLVFNKKMPKMYKDNYKKLARGVNIWYNETDIESEGE